MPAQQKPLSLCLAISLVGLFALSANAEPELTVVSLGDELLEISATDIPKGEPWVIQDSYDGETWRDLGDARSRPLRERRTTHTPTRLFRAANKDLETPEELLQSAMAKWEQSGLTNYFYRYQRTTAFFLVDQLMNVKDGVAEEAVDYAFRDYVIRTGESIDDLFTRIAMAFDEGAALVSIRYHPTLGYPESGYVDYSEMIADEEWSFAIVEPPTEPLEALAAARAKWANHGRSVYQFDLHYQNAWWTNEGPVGINNGEATFLGKGFMNEYVTRPIEEYFDEIEDRLSRVIETNVYTVAFHPELGYPTVISDNWWSTVVDGGQRFWLSDLRDWTPPAK